MYHSARYAVVLQVFFLDFGNTAVVASSSLRGLPSDLLSDPFQASYTESGTTDQRMIVHLSVPLWKYCNTQSLCLWSQAWEFQITGMRPSAQSIIMGNQWSSRARDRFITLVKGHSVIVSLYSILHNVMRVQLLINTETMNTNVVNVLVEEGHAVKAEESFDSKVTPQFGSWIVPYEMY